MKNHRFILLVSLLLLLSSCMDEGGYFPAITSGHPLSTPSDSSSIIQSVNYDPVVPEILTEHARSVLHGRYQVKAIAKDGCGFITSDMIYVDCPNADQYLNVDMMVDVVFENESFIATDDDTSKLIIAASDGNSYRCRGQINPAYKVIEDWGYPRLSVRAFTVSRLVDNNGFITEDDVYISYPAASEELCVGDTVNVAYEPQYFLDAELLDTVDSFNIIPIAGGCLVFECQAIITKVEAVSFEGIDVPEKPVIYLYPEEEAEIHVTLDFAGDFLVTIPAYENGWTVIASPDGTLRDQDGTVYPYLFWEGILDEPLSEITEGVCIPGDATEDYLRKSLSALGLNEAEAADFIEYWLPRMENNHYNLIQFRYEEYTDRAPLTVSPAPDSVLRVFMTFKASEDFMELPAQELRPFHRHGFAVVEWGGCEQT